MKQGRMVGIALIIITTIILVLNLIVFDLINTIQELKEENESLKAELSEPALVNEYILVENEPSWLYGYAFSSCQISFILCDWNLTGDYDWEIKISILKNDTDYWINESHERPPRDNWVNTAKRYSEYGGENVNPFNNSYSDSFLILDCEIQPGMDMILNVYDGSWSVFIFENGTLIDYRLKQYAPLGMMEV